MTNRRAGAAICCAQRATVANFEVLKSAIAARGQHFVSNPIQLDTSRGLTGWSPQPQTQVRAMGSEKKRKKQHRKEDSKHKKKRRKEKEKETRRRRSSSPSSGGGGSAGAASHQELLLAAALGDRPRCRELVEQGADVAYADAQGSTALHEVGPPAAAAAAAAAASCLGAECPPFIQGRHWLLSSPPRCRCCCRPAGTATWRPPGCCCGVGRTRGWGIAGGTPPPTWPPATATSTCWRRCCSQVGPALPSLASGSWQLRRCCCCCGGASQSNLAARLLETCCRPAPGDRCRQRPRREHPAAGGSCHGRAGCAGKRQAG